MVKNTQKKNHRIVRINMDISKLSKTQSQRPLKDGSNCIHKSLASFAHQVQQQLLTTSKMWTKLFFVNNKVSNRAIPGRPRISTREEDAILVREAENHPFLSIFELKKASKFSDTPLTAMRRVRKRGIRSRRTATKEHLKIDHIVDRLAYATIRQEFHWRNIIFSEETVVSNVICGPPLVYHIDGHRYEEPFMARLRRAGRVTVACWWCMSYDWAGILERIHGQFTVDTCGQNLTNVMIPSA